MNKQAIDVDTAETLAGVVRLLRQAAALVWAAADRAGAGSAAQLFALGVDLAADQARHLVPDGTGIEGPVPVGDEPADLLRSAELLLRRLATRAAPDAVDDLRATVADWCGRRAPVSAGEGRTVGELLDDSDGLAREALLDMSADRALGMVRGRPQLMRSAAELSAVLPPDPTISANADPIAIFAAMGSAVDRGLTAGHWPGRGPSDEAWEQIASNFVQARRLLEEKPAGSEAVSTDDQIGLTTAKTQVLHALYVAAHAISVALTGYQRDLHHRLDVGARRRQPFVERPTALEVESGRAMIARFDAVEQLAAGSLGARRSTTANQPATGRRRQATRIEAAVGVWEIQAHRTLANHPDAADLVRVARVQALIATTTVVVGGAATRRGEIDAGVIKRLTPALENTELAWSRSARRWAELTTPASRTDPALVEAASQLRAAIRAAVASQTGWATPDEIAGRIDLPATVMTLHRSLLAGVELAYMTREIAADHPGLVAPARVIAMRAQGEAEVAIEQGETRFEGVRWVTPHQIAANQVIPVPEPARRGLVNAATDVAAATNQAVAAAAHLRPTEPAPRVGADGAPRVGRAASKREIPVHHPNRGGRPR